MPAPKKVIVKKPVPKKKIVKKKIVKKFASQAPKYNRLLKKYRSYFIADSADEYDRMAKALIAWIKGFEARKKLFNAIKDKDVRALYKKKEFGPTNKKATDDFFKQNQFAFCEFFWYAKSDPQVPIKPSKAASKRCR